MREILFRGKRFDTGEFVYGNFVMDATEWQQRERQVEELLLSVGFIRRYNSTEGIVEMHEVDRDTVGQFTGLYDKDDMKIFDGDIVRHHNDNPYSDVVEKGCVYWDEKFCCWRRTSNGAFHHGKIDTYRMGTDCVYEVIGNIHDNPELLEGETE